MASKEELKDALREVVLEELRKEKWGVFARLYDTLSRLGGRVKDVHADHTSDGG